MNPHDESVSLPRHANERMKYDDAPRLPEQRFLDPGELVSGSRVELEIGPGRGGFMFERLHAQREVALLGLEIRRKWASIVDQRLAAQGLRPRARVFAEDCRTALPRLASGSISAVFVHFPDPWWKKRHQKRSVINNEVVGEFERLLAPRGELFIQTDVPERAVAYEALLAKGPGLVPVPGGPRVDENPYGARSPRERRALRDGLPVVRLRYRRL